MALGQIFFTVYIRMQTSCDLAFIQNLFQLIQFVEENCMWAKSFIQYVDMIGVDFSSSQSCLPGGMDHTTAAWQNINGLLSRNKCPLSKRK